MLSSALPTEQRNAAKKEPSVLRAMAPLFYASKFVGLYPHDFRAFSAAGNLKASLVGSLLVGLVLITVLAFYTTMVYTMRNDTYALVQSTLGVIIALILTFSTPFIMTMDQLNAIWKQQHLVVVFNRLSQIDARLAAQNIKALDNQRIGFCVRLLMALTVGFELFNFVSTYTGFVAYNNWLWIVSFIPTLLNSLDKIWFVGLTLALKRRFAAINESLDNLAVKEYHIEHTNANFLAKEIVPLAFHQQGDILNVLPEERASTVLLLKQSLKRQKKSPPQFLKAADPFRKPTAASLKPTTPALKPAAQFDSELTNNYKLIEERFNRLCQLHCDICDLAQQLNAHWSLPILCLMGYSFVTTVAQLYFLYAARWDDQVPSVFVSAYSVMITTAYVTYLSGKCVAIMFTSWKCTLEAKKTGICFHRYALIANTPQIYELVNHLSLKLLNHVTDFSAGGFFRLDMANLFGILGGLTSYLIIFIQFDLEAKQQDAIRLHSNEIHTTPTTQLPTYLSLFLQQP